MQPDELIDRYYASVRARDIDSFMALFANEATFELPDGREVVGALAIREMELHAFNSGPPMPRAIARIAGEKGVAVEVLVELVDGSARRMGSFFHLNDQGLIQRLSVYRQG